MRFSHMLKSRYDEEVNILDFHSKIKGSNPFAVTKMGANVPRGDEHLQCSCGGFNSHCLHKMLKQHNWQCDCLVSDRLQVQILSSAPYTLLNQLGDYNSYKVGVIGSSPIQSTKSGCSLMVERMSWEHETKVQFFLF